MGNGRTNENGSRSLRSLGRSVGRSVAASQSAAPRSLSRSFEIRTTMKKKKNERTPHRRPDKRKKAGVATRYSPPATLVRVAVIPRAARPATGLSSSSSS